MSVRLGRTIDVLLACATALVIWIGGNMALKGQMTAGEVVVFLTYLKRSFKPAQEFAKYTARLAKAAAAGERVIEILEQQPTIRDASDAQPAPRFRGHIELNDVVFGFHPEHPILAGVNLTIAASQRVALVGPSGGGKTTLLNHVLRLIDPTSGSVTIDGLDLRSVTLESMRSQTTSVMQDALLLADTIHENIVCARPDASRAEVIEAAKLANAHQFIMQTPGGYDSLVGERGSTLSRGQRQRIAIARAAIRRAPILVLDEPTVGLDEDSESIVTEALGRLSVDRTTLLVTHNMSLAAQSDVIAFLDHGQVVEFGPHEMLLRQSGRYAQWFTDQIRRTQGTSDEATR